MTALGLGLTIAYAVYAVGGWGGQAVHSFFVDWVYDAVTVIATVLCGLRAIRVREERAVWSLVAVAFALELTGNVLETALYGAATAPVPSAADVFWIAFYVPLIVALALRVRAAAVVAGVVIFDVLIATGALGAVSAAFVLDAILANGSGSTSELVTTLAYPVADLVLVGLVLQLAAASGWRLGRATSLMAGCFVLLAVTDTIFAFETARGTYVAGGVLDLGWLAPYALFGVAAWMRPDKVASVPEAPGWRALALPVSFALVGLVMVVYSGIAHVNPAVVAFGTSALVFVIVRFVVTFRSYLDALARTRLILETAHDAFISFDADGRITDWNPEAEATFGWARQEVLGRDLTATIIPQGRRDAHRRSIARFLATDGDEALGGRVERTVVGRDGREFPIEWTISPLANETGWTFNAFMRDITDRRRAQDELSLARDEALEASRMKSIFVANVSHEIRTPMNGVIGIADVLLGTELDPQQREFVETISASGDALLGIIDDILDFSKIEAGKLELDPTDFDLREAVERACGMLATRAHEKGLELLVSIEPELPTRVRGDAARIRQVITNFVSNAIKFTGTGEVVVRTSAVSSGEHVTVVRLEVSDTGIGIESETLAELFTPFSQADGSTTRKYGGTGLGLAISKQLIELMGGRFGAESQPGEGSHFWFEVSLPRAQTGDDRPSVRDELAAIRVIVVDDNATSRAILARTLRHWELDCDVAADADAAISMVESAIVVGSPYALGLIDLNMPGVDGRELGRRLRARTATDAMRLVLLKPAGADSAAAREDAATFNGSLTKPVRHARLYEEVLAVIGGDRPASRRRERSLARGADPAPDAASPCVLVVEDTEVNQVVATLMLKRAGFRSQVVSNGREAIALLSRGASFAAALMDCQMPELDGYETTREIRRREHGVRRMPIIAMTANSMQGERERCVAAGMDDYLTKPLRLRTLQDALARWIGVTPPAAPAADETGPVGAALDDAGGPLLDEAVLTQIENLDRDMLTTLLPVYSVQAAGNISELGGAVERGEMLSVARTAHKLKGSSGAIGAGHVSRLAGALETSARAGDLTGADQIVGDLRDRLDQTMRAFRTRAAGSADHAENRS